MEPPELLRRPAPRVRVRRGAPAGVPGGLVTAGDPKGLFLL